MRAEFVGASLIRLGHRIIVTLDTVGVEGRGSGEGRWNGVIVCTGRRVKTCFRNSRSLGTAIGRREALGLSRSMTGKTDTTGAG